jgi:hypothetical protein
MVRTWDHLGIASQRITTSGCVLAGFAMFWTLVAGTWTGTLAGIIGSILGLALVALGLSCSRSTDGDHGRALARDSALAAAAAAVTDDERMPRPWEASIEQGLRAHGVEPDDLGIHLMSAVVRSTLQTGPLSGGPR